MSLRHSFINSPVPCIASPNSSNSSSPYRRTQHPAISYTPEAWRALVDHATILPDGTITTFNDGTTI